MRSRVAILLLSAAGFHGSVVGAPLDLTANVRSNDAAISASALGQIPLGFERGCGSLDPDIYHASGLSYHVAVAADRMAVRLVRLGSAAAPGHEASPPRSDLVRLRFIDANTRARSEALDTQPGYANYLKGNDTARACTDVTRFSRVRFSDVYPAIDLVYYGDGRELEFDVLLRPGADPRRVRFVVEPATNISVSAEGDLDVDVGGEALKLRRPVAYQQIAGRRVAVKTDFVLTDGVVSLRIADYDTAAELVVDPVLSYGTYLGGALKDYGTAAAVDAAGNLFVAGYTTSADFPTLSFFDKTLGTNDVDAFVLKLAATGKTLIYSTLLGGTGIDRAMGIAIDATGNAYVTGVTSGGFPTTAGAYQTTSTATNSFVTKLAPAGNALVYSTYVQGVEANGIAIDASGSAYVTGKVVTAITPTAGAYRSAPAGAFVVKLNPAGTAASYATYLGGGGAETATGIAVDTSGNAYVAGTTSSDAFPTVNAIQPARGGGSDGFIAKLNPAGNALIYSTYLGGSRDDTINAVAIDVQGNVYVVGETWSADLPTYSAYMAQKPGTRLTNSTLGSAFFAKVNAQGNDFVYLSYLGGEICLASCAPANAPAQTPGDAAYGIDVDGNGNAYISGIARSYTFPLVNSLKTAKTQDAQDSAFVAKVGRTGSTLLYSTLTRTGTAGVASPTRFPAGSSTGIAVDNAGAAFVTGDADSVSNFTTLNAYQTTNGGGQGAVALKLAAPAASLSLQISSSALLATEPVTLTATVATGTITGNVLFRSGTTTLATVAISNKTAAYTGPLPIGIHQITAVFAGAGNEIDSNVATVVVDNSLVCQ